MGGSEIMFSNRIYLCPLSHSLTTVSVSIQWNMHLTHCRYFKQKGIEYRELGSDKIFGMAHTEGTRLSL